MNVHEKLGKVQRELRAPKGQYNNFGKYHYRSCEDILEAVKPLLCEVMAVLTITDGVDHIGDRYYITATATFSDAESGESLFTVARAREEAEKKGMDGAQITGSASSYARKYALNGLFCIDDGKDGDSTNEDEAKSGGLQPPGPICADCNSEVMPYNDGKQVFTAAQMGERTNRAYGRTLCVKCGKAEGKRLADEGIAQ